MYPPPNNVTTKFAFKASDLPINGVTVFRSSNAQVIRSLRQDLKAGNNVIEITQLSSYIDTESFRVLRLGDGARLLDVVCSVCPNIPERGDTRNDSSSIRCEMRGLEIAETEASKSEQYLRHDCSRPLNSSSQETASAERPVDNTRIHIEGGDGVNERRQSSVRHAHQHMPRTSKGETNAKAVMTILANEDKSVALAISYIVGNARWTPSYDLYATSEKGLPSSLISLHFHADLSQITGEDWTNAPIAFSTAVTDSLDTIPELKSIRIQLNTSRFRSRSTAGSTLLVPNTARVDKEIMERSTPSVSMYEGISFVSKSPLSVKHGVKGIITVPSDGESRRVFVKQWLLLASISLVTVPSQKALAYFQGVVTNMIDHRLPPGPVSVFLDEECVSKASIPDLNRNTFYCSLGVDLSTQVFYSRTSTSVKVSDDTFTKETIYISTTRIQNNHRNYPITIAELSSIPVAPEEDKSVKVILRQPAELAESRDNSLVKQARADGFKPQWVEEMEGVFAWVGVVDSGQTVTLVSEWEINAPGNVEWFESSSVIGMRFI